MRKTRDARYNRSPKGRARYDRYNSTPKGQLATALHNLKTNARRRAA